CAMTDKTGMEAAPLAGGPPGSGLMTGGFAVDRTRQEELEHELARHVGAHAEVLEKLGTAIAIFSTDTRLAFHNTAFQRLWRLESDWLAAEPGYAGLLDLLRERRRLPEVADWRAYREEELKRFTSLIDAVEDLLHLPDGSTLRRVITPHPFGGLLFTYEDVTDALALERSYNTSLAVQRETLDNLHEGVAVFGGDGRLRLSNPAYAKIWALPPADLAGEPHVAQLVERLRPFFGADWPKLRERLLALSTDRAPRHGRLERIDGSILDHASVPLPDGAVLTTWLDVTDTANVERALRERNDALREADRLKSEFIANVSCEVRTPLTTIIGFSEVLAAEYFGRLNRRQADYARGITEAGQSLHTLIGDILDLATIEAGQMTLQLNAFDIHAMLVNVLNLTRERLREKSLTLNFDCPLDIGWMVGDERRLKQVLFNLLSNAVKFTPAGGQITLACQRDGGDMAFTVADTGVGIPEAEQERVFDAFRRGAGGNGGPGLGLSLVRNFVDLHGGRVEVASVPGEGTTVTCRIPASEEVAYLPLAGT
ncbi:MAG: PAS-domain containing protein, partial [Alphaproteobacteria bacterium]|nr:PAS-domain containing protein [Alphaproteobacteria bacterium]